MFKNYRRLDDNNLINLYVNNADDKAFTEIYTRYVSYVYSYVYTRVGNTAWTEDIVGETFISLIELSKKYNNSCKLSSFIIGISLNKIKQYREKNNNSKFIDIDEELYIQNEEYEVEFSKTKSEIVMNILDKLPENYKQILIERFINNLTMKEAAEKLGISEENVRVLQHRALKKAAILGGDLL
ncbi:MAG: sigma-70 family RNA polymerase sigma factor [bacterium]